MADEKENPERIQVTVTKFGVTPWVEYLCPTCQRTTRLVHEGGVMSLSAGGHVGVDCPTQGCGALLMLNRPLVEAVNQGPNRAQHRAIKAGAEKNGGGIVV